MDTLADRIAERNRLEPRDAVTWALRLARALEPLHRRGGAHGAVSAEAVRVEVDPTSGRVRGALADPRFAPTARDYHSPERTRGGSISPADDTWAVAVVLFQALTGRLPFPTDPGERAEALEQPTPPRLVTQGVEDAALDDVLSRALEPDRMGRVLMLSALCEGLEDWLIQLDGEAPSYEPLELLGAVPELMGASGAVPSAPTSSEASMPSTRRIEADLDFEPPRSRPPSMVIAPKSERPPPSASGLLAVHGVGRPPDASGRGLGGTIILDDPPVTLALPQVPPAPRSPLEQTLVLVADAEPPEPVETQASPGVEVATAAVDGSTERPEDAEAEDAEPEDAEPDAASPISEAPRAQRAPSHPPRSESSPRSTIPWLVAAGAVIGVVLGGLTAKLGDEPELAPASSGSATARAGSPHPSARPLRSGSSAVASTKEPAPETTPPLASAADASAVDPSAVDASAAEAPAPEASTAEAAVSEAPARPLGSLSACLIPMFADGTFAEDVDLSFVCDVADPRRGADRTREAVVRAGMGRTISEGMREWAVMGWFELATFAVLRAHCCPHPEPLSLPAAPGVCPSVVEALDALGVAATLGADETAVDAAVDGFSAAARCIDRAGAAKRFGGHPPLAGGEETSFRKTLERVRRARSAGRAPAREDVPR